MLEAIYENLSKDLNSKLFTNSPGYNKLIRPVQNMTQKVQVAFGLAFIQLINVVSFGIMILFYILVSAGILIMRNLC